MKCYYKSKTKEEIEEIIEKSNCTQEVMKYLGYSSNRGNSYAAMKKYFSKLGVDFSKFSKDNFKNYSHPKYDLDEILVEDSNYFSMHYLKERILKSGLIKYECSCCGNKGEWQGRKLVLQLDHINGNNRDNRIENLRFLCPNCHSQTETFCRKNKV